MKVSGRLTDENMRFVLAGGLLLVSFIVAVDLWFVDQITMQRVVGALMATELVAFAMLCYVYYRQNFSEVSGLWLLIGCGTMAIFLMLALYVGAG